MNVRERLFFDQEQKSAPISLDELLACPTGYIDDRQVKGIFYDRAFKTFFLFVRRSVYSIPDDDNLVAKHFAKNLIESHLKSPKQLNLSDSYPPNEFELVATSWVKNLRYTAYLVPASSQQYVFEIAYKRLALKFQRLPLDNYLGLCTGQTLQVESSVFCLDEHQYYKLSGNPNFF